MIAQHHPLSDITAALIAKLRVPAVLDLALGGVHNEVPDKPRLPLLRVVVRGHPVGPLAGKSVWECEAEVDAYAKHEGDLETFALLNVVIGLLNLQELVVSGWKVISMSVLDLVGIPDEEVNGDQVKRLSAPVLLQVVAA